MNGFLYAVLVLCLGGACVRSIVGLVFDIKRNKEQRELRKKLMDCLEVEIDEQ